MGLPHSSAQPEMAKMPVYEFPVHLAVSVSKQGISFQEEVLEITRKCAASIQNIYNHLTLGIGHMIYICTCTQADRSSPSPSLSHSFL